MKSLWKGTIQIGLLKIPVKVYSAFAERGVDFTLLHEEDLSPIKYSRTTTATNREIPATEIVKGFEYEEGKYIVVDDEELEKIKPDKRKSIRIRGFVEQADIEIKYYSTPYYLAPQKGAEHLYSLLNKALSHSNKLAIAQYVWINNKENLGVLKAVGNAILLNQLRYKEEIKSLDNLKIPKEADFSKEELGLLLKLIEKESTPFNINEYEDTYTKDLKEYIESKIEGKAYDNFFEHDVDVSSLSSSDISQLLKMSLSEKTFP